MMYQILFLALSVVIAANILVVVIALAERIERSGGLGLDAFPASLQAEVRAVLFLALTAHCSTSEQSALNTARRISRHLTALLRRRLRSAPVNSPF